MVEVCLHLKTYTRENTVQTRATSTVIPGIPRKGEVVVIDYLEYTVTQVFWNDYRNSPGVGVIVEAAFWEGRD